MMKQLARPTRKKMIFPKSRSSYPIGKLIFVFSLLLLLLQLSPAQANQDQTYFVFNVSSDFGKWRGPFDILPQVATSKLERIANLLDWNQIDHPMTLPPDKYARTKHFGRWINDPTDESCFNTRALVLQRDSLVPVKTAEANKCRVMNGKWVDPYTNKVSYESTEMQIDHLVPLKNAYQHGAWRWSFKARCLYANFRTNPTHLLAVDAHENMSKSDAGPEKYMPPNKNFRCEYLKRWLTIKYVWNLSISESEGVSIANLIDQNNCNTDDFKMDKKELESQRNAIVNSTDPCKDLIQ